MSPDLGLGIALEGLVAAGELHLMKKPESNKDL
jgi:hypothetical protein